MSIWESLEIGGPLKKKTTTKNLKEGDWRNLVSVTLVHANHISYCQLATAQGFVLVQEATLGSTFQERQNPVRSKAKKKPSVLFFIVLLIRKYHAAMIKLPLPAASKQISVGVARLTVTTCISCTSFLFALLRCLQQFLVFRLEIPAIQLHC